MIALKCDEYDHETFSSFVTAYNVCKHTKIKGQTIESLRQNGTSMPTLHGAIVVEVKSKWNSCLSR